MESLLRKKKYLFLHLGPGGNSSLERIRHQDKADFIDFWDQPILRGHDCTFENFLKACVQRYDSHNYSGVIAHSFGCDLARYMVGRTRRPIDELIFLSPLHDLAYGFANFAEKLGEKKVAINLKSEIAKRPGFISTADEMEKFWNLIQNVAGHPQFLRTYWATETAWNAQQELHARLTPLDLEGWKCGIEDFLLRRTAPPDLSSVAKKSVYLGDNDPFYDDVEKEVAYWQKLGFDVSILKNTGHYTHIEGNAL